MSGECTVANPQFGNFRKCRLQSVHKLRAKLIVHLIARIRLFDVAGYVRIEQERVFHFVRIFAEAFDGNVNIKTDVLIDNAERDGVGSAETVVHHFFEVEIIDALVFPRVAAECETLTDAP